MKEKIKQEIWAELREEAFSPADFRNEISEEIAERAIQKRDEWWIEKIEKLEAFSICHKCETRWNGIMTKTDKCENCGHIPNPKDPYDDYERLVDYDDLEELKKEIGCEK